MKEGNQVPIQFNKIARERILKGKRLCGRLYDHDLSKWKCSGSIPTRFQRMRIPQDANLINPSCRIDYKHFYKSIFNKDPGPGSYSTTVSAKSPSFSQKGYGNGFVSEEERVITHNASFDCPGPGLYDPEKSRGRSLATRVFSYTGRHIADCDDILKLDIPFDENNPLNYIKPISLNVYIKPTLPGPGEYNIHSTLRGNGCQSVFKSGMGRTLRFTGGKSDIPGVGQYTIKSEFEDLPTKKKAKSEKKNTALAYEWLGDDAELVNKNYIKEIYFNSDTNIVNYGKIHEVQKIKDGKEKMKLLIEDNVRGEGNVSAVFAISDIDRFGEAIRPKKPLELKPGPEDYNINLKPISKNLGAPKMMPNIFNGIPKKLKVQPGPAFYNPQKEPPKMSFHLNVGRKWM